MQRACLFVTNKFVSEALLWGKSFYHFFNFFVKYFYKLTVEEWVFIHKNVVIISDIISSSRLPIYLNLF